MNDAQMWWLQNTAAGRRMLDRMPRSMMPPPVRRQLCREAGHDALGDGTCARCGEKIAPDERNRR